MERAHIERTERVNPLDRVRGGPATPHIVPTETVGSMLVMTRTPTIRTVAIGLAATLAIGGGTVAVAGAADTSSAPATATVKGPSPEKRAARRAERQKAFATALGVPVADVQKARATVAKAYEQRREDRQQQRAETLGVTVQQLRDQRADKAAKRLATAVKNGRLTQSQADDVVAAIRKGEPARKELREIRKEKRADQRADRKAPKG